MKEITFTVSDQLYSKLFAVVGSTGCSVQDICLSALILSFNTVPFVSDGEHQYSSFDLLLQHLRMED